MRKNQRASGSRKNALFFVLLNSFTLLPSLSAGDIVIDYVPYKLELGAKSSFLYGDAQKIVFRNSKLDLLSELTWEIKPLWYVGGVLAFGPAEPLINDGVFVKLSFLSGYPEHEGTHTGTMEDRDFLASGDSLSHYSISNAYVMDSYLLDLSVGKSFSISDDLVLRLSGNFSWHRYAWEARGGYKQYADETGEVSSDGYKIYEHWSSSIEKDPLPLSACIAYEQNWFLTTFGADLVWPINPIFELEVGTLITVPFFPFLTTCYALDEHLLRNIDFNDLEWLGFMVEPRIAMQVNFFQKISLRLDGAYRWAYSIGDGETVDHEGVTKRFRSTRGGSFSLFEVSASLLYTF